MAIKYDKILGKIREEDGFSGEFDSDGYIMNSTTKRWLVTVDDTGALTTTEIVAATSGQPIGLLLSLTYS